MTELFDGSGWPWWAYVAAWYSLAAGLCRFLLEKTTLFGSGMGRDVAVVDAAVVWLMSPVMLPLLGGVYAGGTVVWLWSFGFVPPPWRYVPIHWKE